MIEFLTWVFNFIFKIHDNRYSHLELKFLVCSNSFGRGSCVRAC